MGRDIGALGLLFHVGSGCKVTITNSRTNTCPQKRGGPSRSLSPTMSPYLPSRDKQPPSRLVTWAGDVDFSHTPKELGLAVSYWRQLTSELKAKTSVLLPPECGYWELEP
jgi:hypothetical protein